MPPPPPPPALHPRRLLSNTLENEVVVLRGHAEVQRCVHQDWFQGPSLLCLPSETRFCALDRTG